MLLHLPAAFSLVDRGRALAAWPTRGAAPFLWNCWDTLNISHSALMDLFHSWNLSLLEIYLYILAVLKMRDLIDHFLFHYQNTLQVNSHWLLWKGVSRRSHAHSGAQGPIPQGVLQPDENQQLSQAFMSFDCELTTWATLSFKMMELKMNSKFSFALFRTLPSWDLWINGHSYQVCLCSWSDKSQLLLFCLLASLRLGNHHSGRTARLTASSQSAAESSRVGWSATKNTGSLGKYSSTWPLTLCTFWHCPGFLSRCRRAALCVFLCPPPPSMD